MFRGQFTYSVDAKGRISIPARLRKNVAPEASDTFIMTQGTAQCIEVFPLDQWKIIEEKLKNLNIYNPRHARMLRITLQHAQEDILDSQSRILVPQSLLNYAKIDKDVLILGVLKKIELWNPEIYKQYLNETEEPYEQLAAEVMAL